MYRLQVDTSIKQPEITDTYLFEITHMHGDADHHTTSNYKSNSINNINIIIKFWLHWKTLDWNYVCDLMQSRSRIEKILTDGGVEDTDWLMDVMFTWDIHYDSGYAHICDVRLFWYDDRGVKYNVKVFDENDQEVKL